MLQDHSSVDSFFSVAMQLSRGNNVSELWSVYSKIFEKHDIAPLDQIFSSYVQEGRLGNYDDLLEMYRKSNGEDQFYLVKRSDRQRIDANFDGVIESNKKILKLVHRDYWANFRLGDALIAQGKLEEAKPYFEECKNIAPSPGFAHERLAYIDLHEGHPQIASQRLHLAIERDPANWPATDLLLTYLLAKGEYNSALDLASKFRAVCTSNILPVLDQKVSTIHQNMAFEAYIQQNREEFGSVLNGTVFADVGAAAGFYWRWEVLARCGLVTATGFEPQKDECAFLSALYPFANFIPRAIGGHDGAAAFHVADVLPCSSLLEPDMGVLAPYPLRSCFNVVKKVPVEVLTLDTLRKREELQRIHFLKLDVQGAEYDILSGASDCLDGILAIELEAQLLPIYKKQGTFFQIFELLKSKGFRLRGLQPQGVFEGEVVEVEAYFAKDLSRLTELDKRRIFLWEAIVGCPQLPFFGDAPNIETFHRLKRTLSNIDQENGRLRREMRQLMGV